MRPRRLPHLAPVVAALALLGATLTAGCGPLADPSVQQNRATVPAERLSSGHSLGQTFVAGRSRLSAVDLLFAVFPAGNDDAAGDLTIRLREATVTGDIAIARVPVASLQHNARYRLEFPPQASSLGRQYYLTVESSTPSPARATVWATADDAYPAGARYFDGRAVAGDLTFRAYYDYDLPWLAADLAGALARWGWLLLPAFGLLLLPGLAVERWLLAGLGLDAAETVGVWLGLSLALAPTLLMLVTLAGGRLDATSVAALVLGAGVLGLARPAWRGLHRQRRRQAAVVADGPDPAGLRRRLSSPAAGAFAVAAGALVLRFVHAKDLVLPAWVDSVHHTLIARLIADAGRLPADYGPLVPSQPFVYHFGFHTEVAWLHWLSGLPVEQAVLFVGQLLGGLIVFPTYLLASRLVGDRRAGLVAALVVGLVSTMPAYYVTWGRYPQLAGLAVLPAAAVLSLRWLTGRGGVALLPVAALLVVGQVLTHPRVALLWAALVLAGVIVWLAGRSLSLAQRLRPFVAGSALAMLSGAVLLPWLARLAQSRATEVMAMPATATLADFPLGRLTFGLDRYLLAAAVIGLAVGLGGRRFHAWAVLLWVGLSLLMANPNLLGLGQNLLLTDDALAIALFLPVAVLVGALAVDALAWLKHEGWPRWGRAAAVLLLLLVGALGARDLAGIVNPDCVFVDAADLQALRWVEANTPASAAFLINSHPWQAGMHTGTDAGYWLPALAGRRASLPPAVYAQGGPAEVRQIDRLAELVEAEPAPTAASLRPVLHEARITHIFIGSRGGPLSPEAFSGQPGYRLAFSNGEAWVFEVLP